MGKKYTIKDAARIMGVPTSTIRYYDKEGLMPNVKRTNVKGFKNDWHQDIGFLPKKILLRFVS